MSLNFSTFASTNVVGDTACKGIKIICITQIFDKVFFFNYFIIICTSAFYNK